MRHLVVLIVDLALASGGELVAARQMLHTGYAVQRVWSMQSCLQLAVQRAGGRIAIGPQYGLLTATSTAVQYCITFS